MVISTDNYCYFVFGIIVTISVLVFVRQNKKSTSKAFKFYLNMNILNKNEVLNKTVQSKLSHRPVLSFIASRLATTMVTDEKFSDRLISRMKEKIPGQLLDRGMVVELNAVFKKGSYVCFELCVLSVDVKKLITNKKELQYADIFQSYMNLFGYNIEKSIDQLLVPVIGEKIKAQLPIILKEKMFEGAGLEVETETCSPAEQTEFLLHTLASCRS